MQVNTADVIKLVGVVRLLNSTYVHLSDDNRTGLHSLFWRVNGHSHIPTNEYMSWFVKGWIAKKKSF